MKASDYLDFTRISAPGKTKVFTVVNPGQQVRLGFIRWYGAWRQYCFFPEPDCVFSRGCLREIGERMETLMAERRAGK